MKIDSKDIINKQYILLDWNVIKYLKKPRDDADKDFLIILDRLRKRFEFPFCEAHLRDLAKSYSEENESFVEDDLLFLQRLSHDTAIGIQDHDHKLILVKFSASKLFKEIIETPSTSPSFASEIHPQSIFRVDMDALRSNHPMRAHLEKANGIYSPNIMMDFLNNMFNSIFDEVDDYKRFREQIKHIKDDLTTNNQNLGLYPSDIQYKDHLLKHLMPFINSLDIEDEKELAQIWRNVISEFLQFSSENIPFGLLISSAYYMLDFHPLFREKLNKKNKLGNIIRDSNIAYFASSGKFFVTEDKSCYKKSTFLFRAFDLNVKVLSMEEFRQKFS